MVNKQSFWAESHWSEACLGNVHKCKSHNMDELKCNDECSKAILMSKRAKNKAPTILHLM